MEFLKKFARRSLPVLILGAGLAIYFYLAATKPVAVRQAPPEPVLQVEAVRLEPVDYRIILESQGTVRARTESTLISEVSGRVLSIAPSFREGGFFEEGEILLEIDPGDYLSAVAIAEANVAEARVRFAEEEAQSSQALRDWERLGSGETPGALVLREPQLALARANVVAAEARLEEARRDLDRTRITAPYEGRLLSKFVDVGQVVSRGTVLAAIYAIEYAEIRLPLNSNEFAMLDFPQVVRGGPQPEGNIPVTLRGSFGQENIAWEGRIVRVEGAVDSLSRQIYIVAQVDDPYGPNHSQPLKVGLFVEAFIEGRILQDVYVLPRTALREAKYVLTIDEENRLFRVPVQPLWSNAEVAVFREPLIEPGTMVSLTQMALALDGLRVSPTLVDQDAEQGNLAENESGELP